MALEKGWNTDTVTRVNGSEFRFVPKFSRGVALITVLMILVFLSVISIYAAETQNISLRRTQNIIENEQAFQIATGGEQWAVKILEKDISVDLEQPEDVIDHFGENWANLGGTVQVEGTESSMLVSLFDQQGKLNLNNLVQGRPATGQGSNSDNNLQPGQDTEINPNDEGDNTNQGKSGDEENGQGGEGSGNAENQPSQPGWYDVILSMFVSLELDPDLVAILIDWIDSNSEITGSEGAEDLYYSGLDAPYLAANQQFLSLAELGRLKGFTNEIVQDLSPHVSVIPVSQQGLTRVNVNTASASVLAFLSLDPLATADQFVPLIELREQQPFKDTEEFMEAYRTNTPYTLKPGMASFLTVQSDYFISRVCVESGRVKMGQLSLLRKNRDKENVTVHYRQQFSGCPTLADRNTVIADNELTEL